MPALARGFTRDQVFSETGVGYECRSPMTTTTGISGSSKVFVEGFGVVVDGDLVGPHNASGCSPDVSQLTSFSSKVSVGGKGVARIGDRYGSDNIITSGSSKVFAG